MIVNKMLNIHKKLIVNNYLIETIYLVLACGFAMSSISLNVISIGNVSILIVLMGLYLVAYHSQLDKYAGTFNYYRLLPFSINKILITYFTIIYVPVVLVIMIFGLIVYQLNPDDIDCLKKIVLMISIKNVTVAFLPIFCKIMRKNPYVAILVFLLLIPVGLICSILSEIVGGNIENRFIVNVISFNIVLISLSFLSFKLINRKMEL